jgi:hypothetical protein
MRYAISTAALAILILVGAYCGWLRFDGLARVVAGFLLGLAAARAILWHALER